MSSSMRRDRPAGAAAGLIGGLAFAWAMQAQGLRAAAGLAGLSSTGTGVALEILAAILIGAGYGAFFRSQPFAYAATISSGVLYGLLWWIAGPLTLAPLLLGRGPGWSLQEADAALPSLVGHVLYGALTGLSFYALVSLYRRAGPRAGGGQGAPATRPHARPRPSGPVDALPYDPLVLALGWVPNFYGLPGLEERAFTLKTLDDATRLRNHAIALLERADVERNADERRRMLTFVVAGGGFAGTEMIAELLDLVHGVLRYYPNIPAHEPRFVLVHSGERILPEISAPLADYALRKLRTRGIEFMLHTRVAGATVDAVLVGDGGRIETPTPGWTAGNQPHPLLRTLPCERNRAGAVVADTTLRVVDLDNVWAAGDCAQIPDVHNEGRPCPPTAQHALRQGQVVAGNAAAALRGQPLWEFRYRTIGTLVAPGHRTALARLPGWGVP